MKKVFVVLLVFLFAFSLFACTGGGDENVIKIVVPDGAPALAVARLMQDFVQFEGRQISYEIVAGATELQDKFKNGEADLAILPTNMASIFYNNSGAKMLSVNTHGVLYLLGKQEISSLKDLEGQVVYNIGRGSVPDISFKYILTQKGIGFEESDTAVDGKLAFKYVTSGSELIPLLKNGTAKFAILGEPAVSQAILAAEVLNLYSIKALWQEVLPDSLGYPQAALTAQKSFLKDENKAFLVELMQNLHQNAEWIEQNPTEAVNILKQKGSSINAALSQQIVQNCNIWVGEVDEYKASVNQFLQAIGSINMASIGGKMPLDDFYYSLK